VPTNGVIWTGRRRRRRHSDPFKAEAVGACQQEGVSISAVALAWGVNASLLRSWVAEAEGSRTPIAIQRTVPVVGADSMERFVPVPMAATSTEGTIRLKIRRGGSILSIEWPASDTEDPGHPD
jgi:transposase